MPLKSTAQLLRGLGKVHKGLSEVEGAKKVPTDIPKATREQRLSPLNIQEMYNERRLFGETPRGEPIRAAVWVKPTQNRRAIEAGRLPREATVNLYPESELLAENVPRPNAVPVGGMDVAAYRPADLEMFPMLEGMVSDVMHSPRHSTRALNELPTIYDIDSMSAYPGTGAMQYQMLYDMMRAQDDINRSVSLSDINKLRRLGNVMSYGLRHGDYLNIAPVSEVTKGRGKSISSQLFDRSVSGAKTGPENPERDYLARLLPREFRISLESMSPSDLLDLSPEEMTGLLALREAQIAGTYGPLYPTSTQRRSIERPAAAITDRDLLSKAAAPGLSSSKKDSYSKLNVEAGIGPNVLGRQITTEEAIARMQRGEDVEEILADILRRGSPEGLRGRYKDGGSIGDS